ncbi:MAG: glucan biosynthesis protein [Planctomycetota bacterium]
MRVRREQYVAIAVLAAVAAQVALADEVGDDRKVERFGYEQVVAKAERLAATSHQPPKRVGDEFASLTYDRYRLIAPRFEKALWRDTDNPFWIEPHHGGFLFPFRKTISIVDSSGNAEQWQFDPSLFQYRGRASDLAEAPGGAFAGFRLLTQFLERPNHQEVASFLGASYFRVLGAYDWYGTSARGLAVDVGLGSPEEFPRFTKFWIKKPTDNKQLTVWALMDSPAVAGAYEFVLRPGKTTNVDVRSAVWLRHGVQKLAFAPLTSMWMWEGWSKPSDESRMEVHDADGLLIRSGDRWVWRPLRRPKQTILSEFATDDLRGFGLMQRDREYENYADNEARYHLRPHAWVEPTRNWGRGHVELLELTATHEGVDNIGAYWVPEQPTYAGARYDFEYCLSFGQDEPESHRLAKFAHTIPRSTLRGTNYFLVVESNDSMRSADSADLRASVDAAGGTLNDQRFELQPDGNWVLSFDLLHEPAAVVDVTAAIYQANELVSEQWSYRWTPQP